MPPSAASPPSPARPLPSSLTSISTAWPSSTARPPLTANAWPSSASTRTCFARLPGHQRFPVVHDLNYRGPLPFTWTWSDTAAHVMQTSSPTPPPAAPMVFAAGRGPQRLAQPLQRDFSAWPCDFGAWPSDLGAPPRQLLPQPQALRLAWHLCQPVASQFFQHHRLDPDHSRLHTLRPCRRRGTAAACPLLGIGEHGAISSRPGPPARPPPPCMATLAHRHGWPG